MDVTEMRRRSGLCKVGVPLGGLLLAVLVLGWAPSSAWSEDTLVRVRKLVGHARASAYHQNAGRAVEKVVEAHGLLQDDLRGSHPVDSPKLRELFAFHSKLSRKLFKHYRQEGNGYQSSRLVDDVLTTLEGLLSRAHSYRTDLFELLVKEYTFVMGEVARDRAHGGSSGESEEVALRFLATLEGLLGNTHAGNRQWFQPLLGAYMNLVKKLAAAYTQQGRQEDLLALHGRAEETLVDALGEDAAVVARIRQSRARLEGGR